ncbi:MAG TPA: S8 family serine peptidase [Solirubrobacterales bacterium]|nr:S8 family serine peptidase [Solirubrobacterales bacterium]
MAIALAVAPVIAALVLAAAPGSALAEPQAPETPGAPGSFRPHPSPTGVSASFSPSSRYIVGLERSVEHPAAVAEAQTETAGGDLGFVYRRAVYGYSATHLSKSDVRALRANPRVRYVVPDAKVETEAQETPTGIRRTGAAENPALSINEVDDTRINADVAVIDTGIDYTHPDLNVVARVNCVPANEQEAASCVEGTGTDGVGHGTHVAGIIGAIDNGIGVVGMAPGVRLWSVRVFNNQGKGFTSWVIAGIEWVTSHASQIEVANMSLGGYGRSVPEEQAIAASQNNGVVYVVAAGNDASNAELGSPASDPEVITVSALADTDGKPGGLGGNCGQGSNDDTLAYFSNWGSRVDVAAPGRCIRSTWKGGGYEYDSGTSMAAPHVTGAVADYTAMSNPNSRADVLAIRNLVVESGSFNWDDSSNDAHVEPVLFAGFTPLSEPEAATGGFSTTADGWVRLHGAVNARKQAGEYYFEYGPTTGYGKKASLNPVPLPAGSGYQDVSAGIVGLLPDHPYHYRLVLKTSSKTAYGADHTFTTSDWAKKSPAGVPVSTAGERLTDVSCAVAGACMAVGNYYNGEYQLASYQLSGGQWTFRPVPLPTWAGVVGYAELDGVSCVTANSCVATGKVQMGGSVVVPLAERWNGSTWSAEAVPAPSGSSYARLQNVSCYGAGSCIAVGYYKNSAGTWVNLSERLAGGTWSVLTTPGVAGAVESELKDVSCASSNFCMAVGGSRGPESSWSLIWEGSSWRMVTGGSGTRRLGVSCTSPQFCLAVSEYSLAEAWNSEKWTAKRWSLPSGAESGRLTSVSCTSASHCTAVGEVSGESRRSSFAENWDNGTWTPQTGQRTAENSSGALSVSCVARFGCASVGYELFENEQLMIETSETVTTAPATEVTATSAALEGIVNPEGTATSYRFEYGPTTAYGKGVPTEEGVGSGNSPVVVSQKLEELPAETTFHYRLVTTSEKGTQYGADRTFRTGTIAPTKTLSIGASSLKNPQGLAVDKEGNLWVADWGNNQVRKFSPSGELLLSFGSAGSGPGQFSGPEGIAFTPDGKLWVTDSGNSRVQEFDATGKYLGQFGSYGTASGYFVEPQGIAVAANGDIWVSDPRYNRIEQFSSTGSFIRAVGAVGYNGNGQTEFSYPAGIAIGEDGRVWVVDQGHNVVKIISPTGQYLGQIGGGSGGGEGLGELNEPGAIAIKPSGDILVTNSRLGRVTQFEQSGGFVVKFGVGDNSPRGQEGIAVGPRGVVYLSVGNAGYVDKWEDPSPEVFTRDARGVSEGAAEITASIKPRKKATSYHFEYGLTTAYGSRAPATNEAAGSGGSPVPVHQALTGLALETTYHYRIVATNGEMTSFGEDRTFTTALAPKLSHMAVTEPFDGTTSAVSNFATTWSALGWASGSLAKGEVKSTGWRTNSGYPITNGAAYAPPVLDTGTGTAAVATMAADPNLKERYFSLWLDMPSSGAHSGYELRFTDLTPNVFEVKLSRWQEGFQTVLSTRSAYFFPDGGSFAIVARGGTVSAWTDTGAGFQPLLAAKDSTFSGGLAGIEASGPATSLTKFKVGQLLEPVASIPAALGALALNAPFVTEENPLSGGGAWAALNWDNSSSGHNTGWVSGGWAPYDADPTVNGAYWSKASFADTGAGDAVAATSIARPSGANQYFSLVLNAPSPGTVHSGYELRFTELGAGAREVALLKWQSGVKTTLASTQGYSLVIGGQFALVDRGGVVSAWANSGSGYTQILSASDSTFTSGYSGIEGSGSGTRIKEFQSGPLPPF